jgi:hypothetical protein
MPRLMLGISIRALRNKLKDYAQAGIAVPPPQAGVAACEGRKHFFSEGQKTFAIQIRGPLQCPRQQSQKSVGSFL